jgi:hypothetical protein
MFTASWRLVAEASYDDPELVPAELWERVHASTRIGALLVWAADEPTRAAHRRLLAQWTAELARMSDGGGDAAAAEPMPEAFRETARSQLVPAAAAAALWAARSAPT